MRRKRHRKNNRKYIILPAIFLLFLFSVGYSAFSSNFLISGKGTIIEKGTISVGGVNVKTVTIGSGLYESEYEEGRYIYRGSSPDNYLNLGGKTYRIISKETDGTLKVIKNESIGSMDFDNNSKGRVSTNKSDYCWSSGDGCNVWGSNLTMLDSMGINITTMPPITEEVEKNLPDTEAPLNTYLNTTWYNSLTSSVQNAITTHLFNVGLAEFSETNISNTLNTEKTYKWSGKVGLLTVSDYVLATTNENCSTGVNGHFNNSACYETNSIDNWLFKDIMSSAKYHWLITRSYRTDRIWVVYNSGKLVFAYPSDSYETVPVFYLKSDITLLGSGKSSDPFKLSGN